MKYKAELFFLFLFVLFLYLYFNWNYIKEITKINIFFKYIIVSVSLLLIACPNIKDIINIYY